MKVLFVGGTGRTGSTVLDRLMGSAPGWFSGGELAFIWRYGLARGGLCSCGVPLESCPVWSVVLERAGGGLDARRMMELRRRFWSIHLPLTWSRALTRRRLDALEEYPAVVERVYRAIGDVTGARVLVDSSKDAHYSMILRERTALDVYFLHLVRDPRATGYSWTKRRAEAGFAGSEDMERRGLLEASIYYGVSNVASERLWRDVPDRYRLLRYEDFVAAPGPVADEIAAFVGEPLDLGGVLAGRTLAPGVQHTSWGNPNRFERRTIALAPDDAWRRGQPRWRSRALAAINAPVARRFGYRLGADAALGRPRRGRLALGLDVSRPADPVEGPVEAVR